MSPASFRERIPGINSWLLAALFFLIPIKVAPAYVLTAVMLGLWIVEGRYAEKWQSIRSHRPSWIFHGFFWVMAASLLWTDNWEEGRRNVLRYTFVGLAPMFFCVARREHAARYVLAFLAGLLLCEVLAYYNWLQLNLFTHWPEGPLLKSKGVEETAPFVDRILYTPALAFGGYLAARGVLTSRGGARAAYAAMLLLTFGNLVFSGGRTGLAAFLVLIMLLVVQQFPGRALVGSLVALLTGALLAAAVYLSGDSHVRERLHRIVTEAADPQAKVGSSIGERYTFTVNTLRIIAEHPLIGVGAGDYTAAYREVNQRYTPQWKYTFNPHNQFLFNLATAGVFGGVALLLLYWGPYFVYRREPDGLAPLRLALPVFFTVISLAESYLWRSNTCLLFVTFSAMLYPVQALRPR